MVVVDFFTDMIGLFISLIFTIVLSFLESLGEILLKPFDFSTDMFRAVLGDTLTNGIVGFSITAGVTLSVIFLVWGLIRVFTGRMSDDIPNPITLVIRFIIAVVCAFWLITILEKAIFPLAQYFLGEAFKMNSGSALFSDSFENLKSILTKLEKDMSSHTTAGGVIDTIGSLAVGVLGAAAATALSSTSWTIIGVVLLIVLLIMVIAVAFNTMKLATENAERYFVINTLIFTAPIAASTIVSEKSSKIFQNWFKLLLSNILTIIFNVIGFSMIMLAFNSCMFAMVADPFDITHGLIALIALLGVCRMAQKFDQLISQVVFKINPIQNRSLLMGAMATIGTMDKFQKGPTFNSIKEGLGKVGGKYSDMARDGQFGNRMQHLQNKRDNKRLEANLEKAGFGKNAFQNGNIAVGDALKNNTPKDLLKNANQALGERGMKVTGLSGSGNNIMLHTGPIDSDGGIGAETLGNAYAGDTEGDYSHFISADDFDNGNYNLPDGMYPTGVEYEGNGEYSMYLSPNRQEANRRFYNSAQENKKRQAARTQEAAERKAEREAHQKELDDRIVASATKQAGRAAYKATNEYWRDTVEN